MNKFSDLFIDIKKYNQKTKHDAKKKQFLDFLGV